MVPLFFQLVLRCEELVVVVWMLQLVMIEWTLVVLEAFLRAEMNADAGPCDQPVK